MKPTRVCLKTLLRSGCCGMLLGLTLDEAGAAAVDDTVTVAVSGKMLIDVTSNDTGVVAMEIVKAPRAGTAVVRPAHKILYAHEGTNAEMDSFEYRVRDRLGNWDRAIVTVNVSEELRIENSTMNLPLEPPPSVFSVVNAFPNLRFDRPTSMESPEGDQKRLFVSEQRGRIYLIPDTSVASPAKVLFLDISSKVLDDGNEQGLKSFALHPDFEKNGYFYIGYVYWAGNKSAPDNANVRLARYQTSPGNPNRADESSEVLLIDQKSEGVSAFGNQAVGKGGIHNIAECNFGPDGYLYVGFGDDHVELENAQRIDNALWSGIIRIDVDKHSENLEPSKHPTGGIPRDANGKAFYAVPADNPFIGLRSFNGKTIPDPSRVRTEFYAVGFRNPWQFSFDSLTGELWVGDVGFYIREEINVVPKGANAGWHYLEGDHQWSAPPADASLLAPGPSYDWGLLGEFQGRSVIGGIVYRGSRYPSLVGKYVFADYVTGHIWSLTRVEDSPIVERLTGFNNIVGLNMDPSSGDILLLDHGEGRIRRLISNPAPVGSFPKRLSETGIFAELEDLTPNPGVVPYTPNLQFWSDHAIKSRFFIVKNLADQFGYARDASWGFPAGAIWVKHFEIETTRGDPETKRRLETRVIVRNSTGAYGVAYRWNDEGTDALLVEDSGEHFAVTINDGGNTVEQTWQIPSRSQCLACHTAKTGHVLGFDTRQLNRDGRLGTTQGNLLALLAQAGYLSGFEDPAPEFLPRHVRPDEANYSLEARVRSYLAVNCANCHREGGTAPAAWDARANLSLAQTQLLTNEPGENQDRLIVPGDVNRSVIWNRISAANGYTRMPAIGSNVIDKENAELVAAWINHLGTNRSWETFEEWRLRWFGNGDAGMPMADPDKDGTSNTLEFLVHTNPLDGKDFLILPVNVSDASVSITLPRLEGRNVIVETSRGFGTWSRWDVPGNDGIPQGLETHFLAAPRSDRLRFFRLVIERTEP